MDEVHENAVGIWERWGCGTVPVKPRGPAPLWSWIPNGPFSPISSREPDDLPEMSGSAKTDKDQVHISLPRTKGFLLSDRVTA